MDNQSEVSVDLRQMVLAIENTVSLVGMNDTAHGKRVGYIAMQIANRLGFSDKEKQYVFDLGLLHDCGVSSDTVHGYLANQFDWENSGEHCVIGHRLLKGFKPLSKMATHILCHHTPWPELRDIDIPENDKLLANLIFLADRVDVTAASSYGPNILFHTDNIVSSIVSKQDTYFDPRLVEAFIHISKPEAFWLSLENRHIDRFAWDMGTHGEYERLCISDLKKLAQIFSYIVDQKSPFTVQHSDGVAALARHIAQLLHLPDDVVDKIEVAAYLHDIGKLHIPDHILEKPGPLSAKERSIINQHSYETYEILRAIDGLGDIAKWAAYHHENCEGTGYPFHPSEEDLSVPARIIAVSDVFQALVQDRPYRKGMTLENVARILSEMRDSGKLDKEIVAVALADAERCFDVARMPRSALPN
ncbi:MULTISPECIES: HD-GYP domain-containing protein [unclassified Maridesulfovibrio]|uniref:HD-GYP domain-containing protein n=1 Tax=unclassified Maridesulfovibrio TaxID=2794999 RepID=UPI003B428624